MNVEKIYIYISKVYYFFIVFDVRSTVVKIWLNKLK